MQQNLLILKISKKIQVYLLIFEISKDKKHIILIWELSLSTSLCHTKAYDNTNNNSNTYPDLPEDNYLVSGYNNVNLNSHASKFKQIIVNVFGVYT